MARSTVAVVSSMFVVGLLLGPLISLINFSGLSLSLSISDIAAIKFTFVQAAYSATLSTALAIPVAKALLRQKFWGKSFVVLILGAPFILPVIVAVLGLILVFGNNGIVNNLLNLIGLGSIKIYGFWGVILAHVFFNLPLAIRILLQAFNDMPGEQYRLVSSLKLSSAQKFLVLEWPVLKKVCPGIWAVIFAICLSSFAVALTLGGGPKATTVELAIYQAFFYDLDFSKAAQLALIQIVLVCSVVFASQFIVKPKTVFGLDIKISNQNPSNIQKIMDALVIIVTLLFIFIPILVIFFYGFADVFFLPFSDSHPIPLLFNSLYSDNIFWHKNSESDIISSGLSYTILRPGAIKDKEYEYVKLSDKITKPPGLIGVDNLADIIVQTILPTRNILQEPYRFKNRIVACNGYNTKKGLLKKGVLSLLHH